MASPTRFRPELLRLEERAVPTVFTVDVGPMNAPMKFSPATETINVGDTVHWVWDSDFHSTTSGTFGHPDGLWDSGVHNTGFTFDQTFNQAGSFPYFCSIHGGGGMTGTIMVQAPGSPPLTPPTPTMPTPMPGPMDNMMPTISIKNIRVVEGQNGAHAVQFHVRLSHASDSRITVKFATVNGTAKAGSDYIATHGIVVFKPGQIDHTITVKVIGDRTPEKDESFSVQLSQPTGAMVATRRGVCTIRNDDFSALDDAIWFAPMMEAQQHHG